ncbi:MAG: hypothetical protein VXV97_11460, partial [Pseudomonadota bacterium]|nr:hypothetical protein [Pseudomonadota bacterium]
HRLQLWCQLGIKQHHDDGHVVAAAQTQAVVYQALRDGAQVPWPLWCRRRRRPSRVPASVC